MPPRFWIAAVLCLTALLLAGCTCGLPKPEDGARGNRASGAGAAALVVRATGRAEQGQRLERAAAFQDYGRYYK
jgi:hypothetical protein